MSRTTGSPDASSPGADRLLEALVEAGFDASALDPLTGEAQDRVDRLVRLLGLLDDYPVDDPEPSLIHAVMARVERAEAGRARTLRFENAPGAPPGGFRIRLPDFITVAASLLIVASIVIPVLRSSQHRSLDTACANNMQVVGWGFEGWSSDHAGRIPVTAVAGLGRVWGSATDRPGTGALVDGGYCSQGHLVCPGNKGSAETSYSAQAMTASCAMSWNSTRRQVALGDRNPILDAMKQGHTLDPSTMTANHGGRRQNVLFNDGSIAFLGQPTLGNDNIWLPDPAARLDVDGCPLDIFLVH